MKVKSVISSCLFLVWFLTVLSFAQDMNPDAGKLYNEGNKFLKAGNYTQAIQDYDKALAIQKDYRIYYQKGIALKYTGKLADARDAFNAALNLKTDFMAADNALGGVYFAMGKYQESVDSFEKVVNNKDAKPNVVETVKKNLALAYTKLGDIALNDGKSEKAIEYLNKAVQNSNYDAAYLTLARVYTELNQWDKAITAAQNALQYRSSISKGGPYYYMGVAYKGKGDKAKAKDMFTQAKSDATYKKTAEYELSILQ
jgi:tetratricopeptide (TPR) repeat protein